MKFKVGDKVKLKGTKSIGCSWKGVETFYSNLIGVIGYIDGNNIWVRGEYANNYQFLERDLLPYEEKPAKKEKEKIIIQQKTREIIKILEEMKKPAENMENEFKDPVKAIYYLKAIIDIIDKLKQ